MLSQTASHLRVTSFCGILNRETTEVGTAPQARELPPLVSVVVYKTSLFLPCINAKESGQGHLNLCQPPQHGPLPLNHTVRSLLGFHGQVIPAWLCN